MSHYTKLNYSRKSVQILFEKTRNRLIKYKSFDLIGLLEIK